MGEQINCGKGGLSEPRTGQCFQGAALRVM